jgi:hypothetical protein
MAINPFPRIQPLEITPALPSGARAPEGTFSNIASLGDAIGQYRERNAMGELLQGAIDPKTGVLDTNKAATLIALSGRDATKYLTLAEAAARAKEASAYRQEALDVAREGRTIQQKQLDLAIRKADEPTRQVVPPTLMNPGGVYSIPREGDPSYRPFPLPPDPPPPVIAPQSAIPGGPNLAAFDPNDPENAPPYRVAGPPMPPPQAPATAAPAAPVIAPPAAPGRNEAILQRLPPAARTIVKGLAEYEIDPNTLTGRDREEAIAAAKIYRPDYNMTEYQKRSSPPSSETQGRMGLAKGFIELIPQIKERMRAGELDFGEGTPNALLRRGRQGELINAIDEGADALLRGLTGAGMPESEAARYQRRYQWSLTDDRQTRVQKLDGLERALRFVVTEQGKGRGGDDLLKGFQSQFGKLEADEAPVLRAKNDREINSLVDKAKKALARDPKGYDEAVRILQQRLPEGVDARRLLGQ